MPLVTPRPDEQRHEFLNRCMSSDKMNEEYPDREQRFAVCVSQYEDK